MMEFEANSDYYRGKPPIERVVLKVADAVTTPELLSGNVDAIVYADRLEVLNLLKDARFEAYHSISPDHNRAIAWNHRRDFFRDARVRRALTLAIDRAELHRVLSFPEQTPIFDAPFTWGQLQSGEMPEKLPYDAEQAKQLLDQAGWRVSGGDGVRARDGRAFRFTLLTPDRRGAEAVYIQNALRQVGIECVVQMMEFIAMRERVEDARFDAALHVVNARLASPIGLVRFFGEESLIGYSNPALIGLLDELQTASAPDEVDRIHREFVPIFVDDVPVTYLYPVVSTTVTSRRVRGLRTPYRADIVSHIDELWLDNSRR